MRHATVVTQSPKFGDPQSTLTLPQPCQYAPKQMGQRLGKFMTVRTREIFAWYRSIIQAGRYVNQAFVDLQRGGQ